MKTWGLWVACLFLAGCENLDFDLAHFTWRERPTSDEGYQEEINNDQEQLARETLRNAMLKRTVSESTSTNGYSK